MHDPYFFGDPAHQLPYDPWPAPYPYTVTATGQEPADTADLGVVTGQWDPAAELAQLLQAQEAQQYEAQQYGAVAADPYDEPVGTESGLPDYAVGGTFEMPGVRAPTPAVAHRRIRVPRRPWSLLPITSFLIAALAAVIVAMVSVFGGIVAYDPLRSIAASNSPDGNHRWWPLLVYGPWMVASLSVLRAALHQRRAIHSWSVALLFSVVAVGLSVAQAPRTPTAWCTAALPPIAALTCFQQLVRQITLTRPLRQVSPRHRHPSPAMGRRTLADSFAPLTEPSSAHSVAAAQHHRHGGKGRLPRQQSHGNTG